MTTFFLVRHAVTAQTGNRLSGWLPDIHLSEEGARQAEAAAEMLASTRIDAVYSSPLERAMETAGAIASRHDLPVTARTALGEVRYGRWTNKSLKTLARTKLWTTVQRFPSGARFPEGETIRETQTRAVDELEAIRTKQPKNAVCCVSHGDLIRLVAAHYLGVHIDLYQRIVISPASVTIVAVGDDGPRVLAVNSTARGITP